MADTQARGSRRCGLLRRSASASAGHTRTKTNAGLVAVVAVGSLILAGCGGTTGSGTSPTASPEQSRAAAPGTCAIGRGLAGTCVVGDMGPGGGPVFYVNEANSEGSKYMEAAPDGWSGGRDQHAGWGCRGTDIPGADGTEIGAGRNDTTAIVTGCATSGIAARLADDYTTVGLTDWFLPDKDELNQLCKYARGQSTTVASRAFVCNATYSLRPGFAAAGYWSSSQSSASHAWLQNFDKGKQYENVKDNTLRVRPVRAF